MIKKINKIISPDILIVNSKSRKIKIINKSYIIEQFEIHLNQKDNRIKKIYITKGEHPNCDPLTNEFCMPEYFKYLELNDNVLDKIINMLKIFNFESAYTRPWDSFNIIP